MSENYEQIFNNKSTFTRDVEFMKDVYIYGTLHYDFPPSVSFGGTSLSLESLTVTGISSLNNLYVSGISTFAGPVGFTSNINATGISTFTTLDVDDLDVDHIDVGIATVRELLELRNDDGTLHAVGFASGPRAGRVGIGSTLPGQSLDVNTLRVLTNIFDSVNTSGGTGFYLSRDAGGIRWVDAAPDAQVDGFFIQNEGVYVTGAGTSFTTINFIGTRSGGDLVHATDAGSGVIDVSIIDHWVKNGSGLHTTSNVGVNQINPTVPLDVNGAALFRSTIEVDNQATFDGISQFNDTVLVDDAEVRVHNQLIVGTATTAQYADESGIATFAVRAGFALTAGIATFAQIAGFSTFSGRSAFSTFADTAGISTVAGFAQHHLLISLVLLR